MCHRPGHDSSAACNLNLHSPVFLKCPVLHVKPTDPLAWDAYIGREGVGKVAEAAKHKAVGGGHDGGERVCNYIQGCPVPVTLRYAPVMV